MKLNQKTKKAVLIVLTLAAAAWCCYQVADAFTETGKPVIRITPIPLPRHLEKDTPLPKVLPPIVIKNIRRFKKYMDTVNHDVRDSILHARPGLIDSISEIEQIYQIR
jgi:hypothetical protein